MAVVLREEVQAAMADVLPSSDPLDSKEFDAVEFINMKFPSERALGSDLDAFVVEVGAQIGVLDDEMSQAVQAQAEAGARAKADIGDARATMSELSTKIAAIKRKAEESEAIAREICRDIKSLDVAKRHLEKTITALKRMHMLSTAVAQLRKASRSKDYGEAGNLLEAIGRLVRYFEPHGAVPRVEELKAEVAATRKTLEDEVFDAFRSLGALHEAAVELPSVGARGKCGGFESLAEACQVIDAIGDDARERQIEAFCADQLAPYRELFPRGGDSSSLDEVDRRFSWIRRLLRTFQDRFYDQFPTHWNLDRRLVDTFVEQTHSMFLEILSSGERRDVTTILKALQKTLVFEKEVQARFDDIHHATQQRRKQEQLSDHDDDHQDDQDDDDENASSAKKDSNKALLLAKQQKPIAGSLSCVFDPFMQPYVALEKKNLEEMTQKVAAEEDVDRDGALPVFASSVQVFAYIKTSVRRCTALSTGQTFFKLYNAFCDCLRGYAHRLKLVIDPSLGAAAGKKGKRAQQQQQQARGDGGGGDIFGGGGGDGMMAASDGAPGGSASSDPVAVACYALNTAEYCAETAEQLGEIVKGKIDAAYVDQVDTEKEVEAFQEVVAAAIKRIVSTIDAALEPALKKMTSTNWGALDAVDDESPYVRDIIFALRDKIPAARGLLSPSYFRNLCDKIAASFLPKFYNHIVNAKRVNEMATHQLLLDLQSLKPLFLDLPNVKPNADNATGGPPGSGDDTPDSTPTSGADRNDPPIKPPATYIKFVTRHATKIEMVLKLVATPTDMLVERFKIMWPDGTRQDLLAVCALKGLRKQDQLALADTFAGAQQAGPP